jgi:hypothetical protein
MMVADASGRFTAVGIPLVMLIRTAYTCRTIRSWEGPMAAHRAVRHHGQGGGRHVADAMGPMLQALLADRFS